MWNNLKYNQIKQRLKVLHYYGYKRDKLLGYLKSWHNPSGEKLNRALSVEMLVHMDARQLTGLLEWAEEDARKHIGGNSNAQ